MKEKIQQLKWKVEYYLYLAFEYLLARLSLECVYEIGAYVGVMLYHLSRPYRCIVRRNLYVCLGREPSEEEVKEVFWHNGGNMVSTFAVARKSDLRLDDHLEVEGEESLREALGKTGAILVLAHMGNWELLTRFTERLGLDVPIAALYRPLNNPKVNQLVLERREAAGMQLISSRNPAFSLLKVIKKKGLICVLSDQRIGSKGDVARFFGQPTYTTRLPLLMHEKTSAPVLTVSMVSVGLAKWRLRFDLASELSQQGIMDQLADGMKVSLPDCFWFQDRWQDFPKIETLGHSRSPDCAVLPWVIESRIVLEQLKGLPAMLPSEWFTMNVWDEGDDVSGCFFGIGDGEEFRQQCKEAGIKRSIYTIDSARRYLRL